MSPLGFRARGALLALPLFLAVAVSPVAAGAAPGQQPPPPAPLPEGPWPPETVLAADPAEVPRPLAAAAAAPATVCPPAPYGVQTSAPGSGKTVALTFDDGPGVSTIAILSILQQAGIPATFFNIGVNSTVRPAEVRSEATLAFPLGNHSWDHPQMPTLSAAAQAQEMDDTIAEQVALVGRPPCIFRPPYGEYNATTLALAQERRMAVWNWSVDTEDWKAGTSTSQDWVDRIITRAEAGGSQQHPVILMHNPPAGIPATVAALPTIIDFYRSRGYTFVDLLGGTGHGRPGPAAAVTNGGLHLFVRGTNGSLNERTRQNGSWTGWTTLGGLMVGGPTAIPVTPTTSGAFVTGRDNQTWRRTVDDTGTASAWSSIGGAATSEPGAAIGPDGILSVAVRGSDAAIWLRQQTGSGWSGWQSLGGVLNAAPALAATAGGGLTVASVGRDDALWVRSRTTTWSAWRRVGGLVTADPALTATPGGLLVVVRGSDNAAWVNVGNATGTSWSGWRSIGGRLTSAPTITVEGSAARVFGYGTDGRIWENVAGNASAGSGWSGWRVIP